MQRHGDPNPFDEDNVNPFAVILPSNTPSISLSFVFVLKFAASIETLDLETAQNREICGRIRHFLFSYLVISRVLRSRLFRSAELDLDRSR